MTTPASHLPSSTTYYLQYSTRSLWENKRNVQFLLPFTIVPTLHYTYQDLSSDEIKHGEEVDYKIFGSGRDGELENWMREVEGGIEDSAGEIRPDSRAYYKVLFYPSPSSPSHPPLPPAIDILSSRRKPILSTTLSQIHQSLLVNFSHLKEEDFKLVLNDNAREEEMREKQAEERRKWEKRTGKEEGISEDLVYDDDVEGEREGKGRCVGM